MARGSMQTMVYDAAIVALAMLVRAPLLRAGFVSDDYILLAGIERRSPLANTPWNLWTFYDGVPARQAKLVFDGALPWWTELSARHAFFRPLSSALLVFAHALFGRHAGGYYLVLLGLCGYNVAVAALLFNRLLRRGAAMLALLIFAVHTLHFEPTRWISAVHVLLATALGLTGWLCHLQWRLDGRSRARIASSVAFVLGLLAGETGLCVLAYVVCHEVVSARGPAQGRPALGRGLLLPVLLGLSYVALYRALRLGAHAIDGYLDPLENLPRFLSTLPQRAAIQLPRLVTAPAEDLPWELPGRVGGWALGASMVLLCGLAAVCDRASLRTCGGWAAGTLLSALPALLGPTDRALYPATLGISAVVGTLATSAWTTDVARPAAGRLLRGPAIAAGALLGVSHVGLGALTNFRGAAGMAGVASAQLAAVSGLDLAAPETTDVVVVLATDQTTGPWGGVLYAFATRGRPRSWEVLSMGQEPHAVSRVANDAIEIGPAGNGGFRMHLYRNASEYPMHVGQRVALRGLSIEVVDVQEGRPSRIRVRADRSLDDPAFCFATRLQGRLVGMRLPPVGMGVWLR